VGDVIANDKGGAGLKCNETGNFYPVVVSGDYIIVNNQFAAAYEEGTGDGISWTQVNKRRRTRRSERHRSFLRSFPHYIFFHPHHLVDSDYRGSSIIMV